MTTIETRVFTTNFQGLTSTAITASVFLVAGLAIEEILKQLRRYPYEDAAQNDAQIRKPTCPVPDRKVEGYAMGYLFRARTYVEGLTTPDYGKYPLMWAWDALKFNQAFFEERVGADATVYVLFLRAAVVWQSLLLLLMFPVLTTLNWVYAKASVSTGSIERASISSLVDGSAQHLLWVHVLYLWLVSLSWYSVLGWLGYGSIKIRRNQLRNLLDMEDQDFMRAPALVRFNERGEPLSKADMGWQQRTVLVKNIPEELRSESSLTEYFQRRLCPKDQDKSTKTSASSGYPPTPSITDPSTFAHPDPEETERILTPTDTQSQDSIIADIVLVRKMGDLNEVYEKYLDALNSLEDAHVTLARNVIVWARKREQNGIKGKDSKEKSFTWKFWRRKKEVDPDAERDARVGDDRLYECVRDYVPYSPYRQKNIKSFWEILANIDPILLDRFQPLTKLKHFRGQYVPSIDFYLAKVNLLGQLIQEKREAVKEYPPAAVAFITFKNTHYARRARHEMKHRAKIGKISVSASTFTVQTRWAPEVRDLDWNRLVYVSISSDITRSVLLQAIVWAATIFWVIPISFLIGFISFDNVQKYFPAMARYLEEHPSIKSLFSNLLPTAIIALLSMLVPTLITIVTRNGQVFMTVSKLFYESMARYWKWMVVNLLIVFCIGTAAFSAFLEIFKQPDSILGTIAGAFPKGATFFVSWSLLVVGVHHGIEHSLLGIAWINHASIRKLKTPRKRAFEAEPRFFSYHYWIPNHLFVLAVTMVFSILNPMVIPFNLLYFCFANVVFRNQIAHVFYRRWFELNGRKVFTRIFRYSLDCLFLAELVIMAFMWVSKRFKLGGACIPLLPLTMFVKLIGTRYYNHLMDEIDEVEADLICGEDVEEDLSVPLTEEDTGLTSLKIGQAMDTIKNFGTITLPSLILNPDERLPPVPSPSRKPVHPRLRSLSRPPAPTLPLSIAGVMYDAPSSSMLSPEMAEPKPKEEPVVVNPPNIATTIVAHPPILRDDRPTYHRHYDNPALVQELTKSLWLPRDPTVPTDLGDTVDYSGFALVSSEGGDGLIGDYKPAEIEEDSDESAEKNTEKDSGLIVGNSETQVTESDEDKTRVGGTSLSKIRSSSILYGKHTPANGLQTIRVASDVAARAELEMPAFRKRSSTGSSSMSGGRAAMVRRGSSSSSRPWMSRRNSAASGRMLSPEPFSEQAASPPRVAPIITGTPNILLEGEEVESPSELHPPERRLHRMQSHLSNASVASSGSSLQQSRQRSHTGTSLEVPTRRNRAGSRLRSDSVNITDIAEGVEPEEEISQADAVRSEILSEERKASHIRQQKEERRAKQEKKDTSTGGWLTRHVLTLANHQGSQ